MTFCIGSKILLPTYFILDLFTSHTLVVAYLNCAWCGVLKSFPVAAQGGRLHIKGHHAELRENHKDDSLFRILDVLPGLKKAKQNKPKE